MPTPIVQHPEEAERIVAAESLRFLTRRGGNIENGFREARALQAKHGGDLMNFEWFKQKLGPEKIAELEKEPIYSFEEIREKFPTVRKPRSGSKHYRISRDAETKKRKSKSSETSADSLSERTLTDEASTSAAPLDDDEVNSMIETYDEMEQSGDLDSLLRDEF